VNRTLPFSRHARFHVVLLAAGALALLTTSGPALAASCGNKVVNDWYDNGRVDKIYPLKCYRDAIRILPTDVLDYSNAKEEIGRALQYARVGKPDPGGTSTGTGTTSPTGTGKQSDTTGTDTSEGPVTNASGDLDASGPSSVPVPLIVLGALAALLLAAGSAGYLTRRMNAGKRGGDGDGSPPTAI
jgi:hypothetical protein